MLSFASALALADIAMTLDGPPSTVPTHALRVNDSPGFGEVAHILYFTLDITPPTGTPYFFSMSGVYTITLVELLKYMFTGRSVEFLVLSQIWTIPPSASAFITMSAVAVADL